MCDTLHYDPHYIDFVIFDCTREQVCGAPSHKHRGQYANMLKHHGADDDVAVYQITNNK